MMLKPIKKLSHLIAGATLIAVGTIGITQQSEAASVTWNLNNFIFTDGAKATGSFVWDSDVNSVLDFNFFITDGTNDNFSAINYSRINGDSATIFSDDEDILSFSSPRNALSSRPREFRISIASFDLLDIPSASLGLVDSPYARNGFTECYNCSPFNAGLPGAFLSSIPVSVPEPASIAGLTLIGIAITSKRRKLQ